MPGRPRDTSVLDDTMLIDHAGGSSKPVAPMRRRISIAEMTRRFDTEADVLDFPAQPTSSPSFGPANDEQMESGGATSDSDESDTDDDVKPDVSDCERSGKVKAKIYAPFLSLSTNDTPADNFASTPQNIRVKHRTDVVKENRNPRQWLAVSSADRGSKSADLTVGCDGRRLPPRYPDWAAEIAEEREKLAAEILAETLDKLAPRPPMNFDSEVSISQRLRVGSVLLPKSKRRKVVHVSTHEA